MRIGSLDDYKPADTDYAVLLCSSEQLQPLPASHGTVVFCFSEEELGQAVNMPVVLADVPAAQATPILARLIRDRGVVEYWAPRSAADNLHGLVDSDDKASEELGVSGLHISERWIHLRVEEPVGTSRPSDDFLRGLSAPLSASNVGPRDQGPAPDAPTLRALVISRVATFAKPVKQFLPSSVVVSLYKILEKIR